LNRSVATQFEDMTNELRKASLIFRKLASNSMSIQKKNLQFIYKNMESMLMNWSSLMESQWRHFRDDFSSYFKYYMFEDQSLLELAKNTHIAEEQYLKKENDLAILKHSLFKVKDFDKWKMLPEDRKIFEETTLIHNKKLTFPKMLPEETKEVEDLFLKYGYYINRMKAEVDRIIDSRINNMFNHFANVGEAYSVGAKEMAKMWIEFEERIEPPDDTAKNVENQLVKINKNDMRTELHIHLDLDEEETNEDDMDRGRILSMAVRRKTEDKYAILNATAPVIYKEHLESVAKVDEKSDIHQDSDNDIKSEEDVLLKSGKEMIKKIDKSELKITKKQTVELKNEPKYEKIKNSE